MAQTSYIDIAPELTDSFFKNLQAGDRYTFARIRVKNTLQSLKRRKGISKRSLLPEISVAWAGLSGAENAAWVAAGAECSMTGWNLFVQDFCARRVNELSGLATPSLLHQSWVGNLRVSAPATQAKLIQAHPSFYYVYKKVYGTKSMYAPVKITEQFVLPLILTANYKSDLTSCGDGAFAKIYAEVWYSYQGVDKYQLFELNLNLISDWTQLSGTLSNIVGIVIRYNLFIEIFNARGNLYIDNIKAEHSSQNWTRDPWTKDLNQGFTRNFYQIPKHWTATIAPEGVEYESIYKDF